MNNTTKPKPGVPPKATPWWNLGERHWRDRTVVEHNGVKYVRFVRKDTQRQKAYTAERTIRATIPNNVHYDSLEMIQARLNKLVASAWFRNRWPDVTRVFVLPSSGCHAWRSSREIKLNLFGRHELMVLHELAHIVCPYRPGHGRYWARAYIELVTHEMGPEAGKMLTEAFKKHKVKFKPVMQLSPEERARRAAVFKARFINKEKTDA